MLTAAVVFVVLLQALTCFFLFQIVRQQGRVLMRLDRLEGPERGGALVQIESREDKAGLAPGTEVPDFELPRLDGGKVRLSELRGSKVLLLYWGSECGFCDMLAPDIVRAQSELADRGTRLLLASYGSAETNRELAAEHGLDCEIALIEDLPEDDPVRRIVDSEIFETCGTPSAYLIDREGRVSAPLAAGFGRVRALIEETLETATRGRSAAGANGSANGNGSAKIRKLPLSRSRIEREGLKAGTPAPGFSLPDVRGDTFSLDQYRGQRLLLVFTDPNCGPCDALAPRLVDLYRKHQGKGLEVVMVGRGNADANKQKVEKHGFPFPYLLQDKWKLSREYGIFATPVAFLIGEDGVIARDVARGRDAIITLAREGLARTSSPQLQES